MTESQPKPTATAAKKEPEITYQQVYAIAMQLADSGKLTTAWIHEKLDSKPAKEFKENELKGLSQELDEFLAEFNKANDL